MNTIDVKVANARYLCSKRYLRERLVLRILLFVMKSLNEMVFNKSKLKSLKKENSIEFYIRVINNLRTVY